MHPHPPPHIPPQMIWWCVFSGLVPLTFLAQQLLWGGLFLEAIDVLAAPQDHDTALEEATTEVSGLLALVGTALWGLARWILLTVPVAIVILTLRAEQAARAVSLMWVLFLSIEGVALVWVLGMSGSRLATTAAWVTGAAVLTGLLHAILPPPGPLRAYARQRRAWKLARQSPRPPERSDLNPRPDAT